MSAGHPIANSPILSGLSGDGATGGTTDDSEHATSVTESVTEANNLSSSEGMRADKSGIVLWSFRRVKVTVSEPTPRRMHICAHCGSL